ncbi:MAG: GAF domain-containing protein, partial [Anaerolineales bacterium]|nr:GAF domain-containing protein [Anaerolineales bacterium]
VNTFAAGSLITMKSLPQAHTALILLAITTPAIPPMLLTVTVALLKPTWLRLRWRWMWRLVYILVILPAVLVFVDSLFDTNIWFSSLDPNTYSGGFIPLIDYTPGDIAPTLRLVSLILIPAVTLLLSLYLALFDKNLSASNRKLAWLLFGGGAITALTQSFIIPYLIPVVGFVISGLVWALIYTYAAFQQMISERQSQTGSLQGRLTALILIVTIPLLVATTLLVTSNAAVSLEQSVLDDLQFVHQNIATTLEFTQNLQELDLDLLNQQVQASPIGENGIAYVVNEHNQVLIHADPQLVDLAVDFSEYAPVQSIRMEAPSDMTRLGDNSPSLGVMFPFTDEYGTKWRAYASVLENEWAIIVQIPENEIIASAFFLQRFSWIALGVGMIFILVLSILTIRQGLLPIRAITETATAIAGGDLTRIAPIDSEGEFGILASAFNSMTSQLRELIANLERRVTERTRDLERRAIQLQVAAEVASEAAAIRDLERLLDHTVHLISDRFDFYHAGIFLIDDTRKYAILRSASSDGGQRMLARGHKLEVGQKGIVGYVAGKGEPRISLDVGEDVEYFNNPDMPRTRSEMALPLIVRQEVIGVLDVQSTKASAFTQDDITVLQILADQIALALDNARLLAESMQAFNELEKLYKQEFEGAWLQRLANQKITYSYNQLGIQKISSSPLSSMSEDENPRVLKLPLSFRGLALGTITLRRASEQPPWSIDDIQLVKTTIAQIVLALENARLMEEIRRRAQDEETLNQISESAHTSLDLETVMKKAVREIGQSLGAAKVQIRLTNGGETPETTTSPDPVQVSGS